MIKKSRSLAKAFSWRIFASCITVIVVWSVSGDLKMGSTVGVVDFALKLHVWFNCAWFGEHLTSFNCFTINSTEKATNVVTSLTTVENFFEHFDTGDRGLSRRSDTDNLYLFSHVDYTAFDTSRNHSATTFDAKNILDRHQEWLILRALRLWDIRVYRRH